MKKLVWRLREQPTSKMLQELVLSSILTKDEAREILFSSETQGDRDKKSLESEIKFLRELVEKLSNSRSQIVTTIKEIEVPIYRRYPWYKPYEVWCNTTGGSGTITLGGTLHADGTATTSNFSNIKTF